MIQERRSGFEELSSRRAYDLLFPPNLDVISPLLISISFTYQKEADLLCSVRTCSSIDQI